MTDIDTVVEHYMVAALWSSTNDEALDSDGSLLDNDESEYMDGKYSIDDFSSEAYEACLADVEGFIEAAGSLLDGLDDEMIGHDIWLTRNGHGAGFWDRGYGEVGDQLSDIARAMGEVNLYSIGGKVEVE